MLFFNTERKYCNLAIKLSVHGHSSSASIFTSPTLRPTKPDCEPFSCTNHLCHDTATMPILRVFLSDDGCHQALVAASTSRISFTHCRATVADRQEHTSHSKRYKNPSLASRFWLIERWILTVANVSE
jgi:hypothetical protein